MRKSRHVKTIQDKYGIASVLDEVVPFFESIKPDDDHLEAFEKCPYIGYLYVPAESDFNRFYYYTEDFDMIRSKVVQVDEDCVWLVHYDDHHRDLCYLRNVPTDGYLVQGNELIKGSLP